jgi:hypothetical protein
MTTRTLLFTIPVVALMALGSSCRTTDVRSCEAEARERLLNMEITNEVTLCDANIIDALTYLDDKVVERSGGDSLNLIIYLPGYWTNASVRLVTYCGTNVTVGAVFREAVRQSGVSAEVIAEALFVGTQDTLRRIRKLPAIPLPLNRRFASQLDQRLDIWQGCQEQLSDMAMYLKNASGVTLDVKEASHRALPFAYRADIRNMRVKNFLWWLAVLSDSEVSLVDDTVKFTLRTCAPRSQSVQCTYD